MSCGSTREPVALTRVVANRSGTSIWRSVPIIVQHPAMATSQDQGSAQPGRAAAGDQHINIQFRHPS